LLSELFFTYIILFLFVFLISYFFFSRFVFYLGVMNFISVFEKFIFFSIFLVAISLFSDFNFVIIIFVRYIIWVCLLQAVNFCNELSGKFVKPFVFFWLNFFLFFFFFFFFMFSVLWLSGTNHGYSPIFEFATRITQIIFEKTVNHFFRPIGSLIAFLIRVKISFSFYSVWWKCL